MPGTSKVHNETDEEDSKEEEEELEFEGLKPKLMKMLKMLINFNAQLCSSKAVAGAEEHCEELKATCEKFQRLLCKASAAEEQSKQKTNGQTKINDMLT